MTRAILALLLLVLAAPCLGQVRVKGYYRKDGTYVAPHYRSAPNGTTLDNYSTKGNYNPYTGKRGTVDPDSPPDWRPAASPSPSYPYPSANALELGLVPQRAIQAAEDAEVIRARTVQSASHARAQLTAELSSGVRSPKSLSDYELTLLDGSFQEHECSVDCSGHEAGYEWAEANGVKDPEECGGNSVSFVEGCQAWAEEQSE